MAKTSNTGTERVARRQRQSANKAQAEKDGLLLPKKGAEKEAAVAEAQKRELAKFGGDTGTVRKNAQAENRAKAKQEAVTLAAPKAPESTILAGLAPGDTPTARQLRLLAKSVDRPIVAEAHEIGREAGRMVKDALLGRRNAAPMAVRRHRRMEQSLRQLNTTNATQ